MTKTLIGCTIAVAMAFASPAIAQTQTGNGAQSGAHYNLNLIGKDNCPTQPMDDTGRHNIHVLLNYSDVNPDNVIGDDPGNIVTLNKTNKIFLTQGDFSVVDGNACDGDGATFSLPANGCPYADCVTQSSQTYTIFVRELGKPGGTGQLTTCGIDEGPDGIAGNNDDEIVCSSENVVLVRDTGKPRFTNETKALTTLVLQADLDGDGDLETFRIGIFDPMLYQYYWDYDNNGLRLVQLRFYPI